MRRDNVCDRIFVLGLLLMVLVSSCTQRVVQKPIIDAGISCTGSLRLLDRTPNTVTLNWDAQSLDCLLERTKDGFSYQVLEALPAGAQSLTVKGLDPATILGFRMRSVSTPSQAGETAWVRTEQLEDRLAILEPAKEVFVSSKVKIKLSVKGTPPEVRLVIRAPSGDVETLAVPAPYELEYDPAPFLRRICCTRTVKVSATANYGYGWIETQPFTLVWDPNAPIGQLISPIENTVQLNPLYLLELEYWDVFPDLNWSDYITVRSLEDNVTYPFQGNAGRMAASEGMPEYYKSQVNLRFSNPLPLGFTFQVQVKAGLKDRAGNTTTQPQAFVFSTIAKPLPVVMKNTYSDNEKARSIGLSASEVPTEVLVEDGMDGVTRVRSHSLDAGGGLASVLLMQRPTNHGQVLVFKDPGQHLFVLKADSERITSFAVNATGLETRCRADLTALPKFAFSATVVASDGSLRNVRQAPDRAGLLYSRFGCDGSIAEQSVIYEDVGNRRLSVDSFLLATDGSLLVAGMRLLGSTPPGEEDYRYSYELQAVRFVPNRGWLPPEHVDSGASHRYGGFRMHGAWLGTNGRAVVYVSSNYRAGYDYRFHYATTSWQTMTDGIGNYYRFSWGSPILDFPSDGGVRVVGHGKIGRYDEGVGWRDIGTLPGFASACPSAFDVNEQTVLFSVDRLGTRTIVRGDPKTNTWNPVQAISNSLLPSGGVNSPDSSCPAQVVLNPSLDFAFYTTGGFTVFGRVP